MPSTVPPPFLFRFSFPVPYVEGIPRRSPLLGLSESCRIPFPSSLTKDKPFADLRFAWNEEGLGVSLQVAGKAEIPTGQIGRPEEADGLQLWIDTRNTLNIHRASRFCHSFCLIPHSIEDGEAACVQLPIPRAREDAPRSEAGRIKVWSSIRSDAYALEAWFPQESLHGFEAEASPKLGFYFCVRDRELGEQYLTVGRDFPFSSDPSLWSTLELVRG